MGAAEFKLPLGQRTLVMGVVNVTPDSFSDGGDFATASQAAVHAKRLAQEGAAAIDIGGESTRPGSAGVSVDAELERVLPVFDKLMPEFPCALSIDTTKARVAHECIRRGARIVNDVSAGRLEPAILDEVHESGAYVVLMHMQGSPRDMQDNPQYGDVLREVSDFLAARADAARGVGISRDRIILDPGIGFGKTLEHNLALLRGVPRLKALGYPVMIGASRKSLFKGVLGLDEPKARDQATAHLTTYLAAQGVDMVRVHDVAGNVHAARLGDRLAGRA